jgi:hypothetical protein
MGWRKIANWRQSSSYLRKVSLNVLPSQGSKARKSPKTFYRVSPTRCVGDAALSFPFLAIQERSFNSRAPNQGTDAGPVDGSLRGQKRGLAVSFVTSQRRAPDDGCKTVSRRSHKSRSAGVAGLYCARHAFGTAAYGATGNLAMVMNVIGHSDVRTAMRYQHPVLDPVRDAIDQRNLRHKPRHNELRVQ